MRVRSILRDMADGIPEAWDRAELKLSQSDVHEDNKAALRRAMAELADPRSETAR